MAEIVFYEKPGCINGEKQKVILRRAGHALRCINILTFPWRPDILMPFVSGKAPETMMNPSAPAIKKGELRAQALSFQEAVELMVGDPILIKRPLIEVDGMKIQGFTDPRLQPYLGTWDGKEDVTTCPNLHAFSCDEQQSGHHRRHEPLICNED